MSWLLFCCLLLGFAQDSDINELERRQNEINQQLSDESFADQQLNQKLLENENFFKSLVPKNLQEQMQQMIKENPLALMDRSSLKSLIESRLEGKPAAKFFKSNPKILDFFVDWMRDKKALPSLFNMINKPDKMKKFSYLFIAVFVMSFILNFMNSRGGLIRKIFTKIAITLSAILINIAGFYFLFTEELSPTIDIFKQTFF